MANSPYGLMLFMEDISGNIIQHQSYNPRGDGVDIDILRDCNNLAGQILRNDSYHRSNFFSSVQAMKDYFNVRAGNPAPYIDRALTPGSNFIEIIESVPFGDFKSQLAQAILNVKLERGLKFILDKYPPINC